MIGQRTRALVLLAEDSPTQAQRFVQALEAADFRVRLARDGREVMETARRWRPDVLVSDVLMPVMDGFALCREVRRDPVLGGMPIVLYTVTFLDDGDREFALRLGATRFVVKPTDSAELVGVVREVLAAGHTAGVPLAARDAEAFIRGYTERLATKLEQKVAELEEANRLLEQRVAERTAALEMANEALQREVAEHRTAETKFRTLFEAAPGAIVIVDGDGKIALVNAQGAQLFGYDRTELLGRSVEMLVPERFRGVHVEHRAKYLSDPGPGRFREGLEPTACRKDGSEFPIEINHSLVQTEGGVLVMSVIQDIADRKRAEQERAQLMREQLARVEAEATGRRATLLAEASRAFGEASPELQSVLDVVARRTAELIGDACLVHLRSVDGQWLDPTALYHPNQETLAALHEIWTALQDRVDEGPFAEVIRTGLPLLVPVVPPEQIRAALGPEKWQHLEAAGMPGIHSVLIVPLRARGVVIGVLGVSRDQPGMPYTFADQELLQDLADRAALAIENARLYHEVQDGIVHLRQAQRQLVEQERLHALGEMASGIAHDFNNALAPILGFSELLLMRPDDLNDKEKVKSYLELMRAGATDAATVVSRLREFYRARDDTEAFEPVDLYPLVEQVVKLTQPRWKDQTQARGITIDVHIDLQPVPLVPGRDAELREALTNVIFNAVDAMPEGGTLTVRTYADGEDAVLEVRDTGIGMTEEVRRRCLEPFFTTKGERGTGLGLAMTYGIVRRHEGRIAIESEVGKGTTFIVRLPRLAVQQPARESPVELARSPALRVLVVDDEPQVRTVVAEYLAMDGHAVETAIDGYQGLMQFQAGRFDLVVADQAMPRMNGEQLAAAVKQLSPRTPVILLTGFGKLMEATGERPEGVDCVVAKPVTLAAFRQAIASAVRGKPNPPAPFPAREGGDEGRET
ncbi:MAG: response regulator [Chloroflexi bacterium]|nr:response regulator [Chloroflexota bacterium]